MAKTLTETPLTTRNARSGLAVGLHWRGIDPDVHLGYRKGKRGGAWLVRWRNGAGYRQERIGTADDEIKQGTLDFNSAVKAAREKVEAARIEARATAEGPALTVRFAVEAYVAERDARESKRKGRPIRSDAAHRLERYVVGKEAVGNRKAIKAAPIADVALHALSEEVLLKWRKHLPEALKGTSKQRLVNDLKAALNEAYAIHRRRLAPSFLTTVKHGLGALTILRDEIDEVARDNQILSDAKVAEILSATRAVDAEDGWEGDLFRLIAVMAATGARFSQVARLRVCDVQPAGSRVMMPVSRKGRGTKQGSTPIPIGSDVIDALQPILKGRQRENMLLERWRRQQVKGSIRWERTERAGWQVPAEIVRSWAKIRKLAKLEADVVPYALRHSSIVRGIRAGLPIRLVAALHDTSVSMIERHYGRWIADGLEELAAKAVVQLIPD